MISIYSKLRFIFSYIFILFFLIVYISCSHQSAKPLGEFADRWGELIEEEAEIYYASDVSEYQVNLTREWYRVAADAWGNYGPLEFWIVGNSSEAALALDKKYCELRINKDSLVDYENCLQRDYSFIEYAKNGNAGLSLIRSSCDQWSGYIVVMSGKYPSPEEEDYKSVVLHEYFHVYQHAHVFTKDHKERESKNIKNPWWSEGGAEYMAQLLYSRQPGVRSGYLKDKMKWKLESLKYLKDGEGIQDIPYGERSHIAYDLGSWFIAFLIYKTSEESYRVNFFKDLNEYGFEKSFQRSFGKSSNEFLSQFHDHFLKLALKDKMRIIP